MGIFSTTFTFPSDPPTAAQIEAQLARVLGEPFELFGYLRRGMTANVSLELDSVAICYLIRALLDLGGQPVGPHPMPIEPEFVRTPWPAIPRDERVRILLQFPRESRRKP